MKGIVTGFSLIPSNAFTWLMITWKTAPIDKPPIIASDRYLETKPRWRNEEIIYQTIRYIQKLLLILKNKFKIITNSIPDDKERSDAIITRATIGSFDTKSGFVTFKVLFSMDDGKSIPSYLFVIV